MRELGKENTATRGGQEEGRSEFLSELSQANPYPTQPVTVFKAAPAGKFDWEIVHPHVTVNCGASVPYTTIVVPCQQQTLTRAQGHYDACATIVAHHVAHVLEI